MRTIVYSSTAAETFDDERLGELLTRSRASNAADAITGLLLYRDGRFLQLLEGPDEAVEAKMAAIGADARHTGVRILLSRETAERRFPEWTMGFRPLTDDDARSLPGFRHSFDDFAASDADDDGDGDDDVMPAVEQLTRWYRAGS